jgi:hypothetical protein
VCPCETPVTVGTFDNFVVDDVMCGKGIVNRTPADVPIHNKSLHAKSDVTLKHAALCCLIMSSQPGTNLSDRRFSPTETHLLTFLLPLGRHSPRTKAQN